MDEPVHMHLPVLLLQVASLIATSNGFLMDECVAPPPCNCIGPGIFCKAVHLNHIPVFKSTTPTMPHRWMIVLSGNSISTVPDNAFMNLANFGNGQDLSIDLSSNQLTVSGIGLNAFEGLASYVTELIMVNNSLTSLPAAISTLIRLQLLDLMYNPIAVVDSSVLTSIGHSLRQLFISLSNVPVWPDGFRNLVQLYHLSVFEYSNGVPDDAFTGFQDSIRMLEFYNTTFDRIPAAVCKTYALIQLRIEGGGAFTNTLNTACNSPLNSVDTLALVGGKMTTFPAVFDVFPDVTLLIIDSTNIASIDKTRVPANMSVNDIRVTNSKLKSFPKALQKFALLERCKLSGNLIITLGNDDLDFQHLSDLILDDNPIVSISRDAFRNVPNLETLSLQGTKLTSVPQAVYSLNKFRSLVLTRNNIICNCQLKWIEQWRRHLDHYMRFDGTCNSTTVTIREFINARFDQCV